MPSLFQEAVCETRVRIRSAQNVRHVGIARARVQAIASSYTAARTVLPTEYGTYEQPRALCVCRVWWVSSVCLCARSSEPKTRVCARELPCIPSSINKPYAKMYQKYQVIHAAAPRRHATHTRPTKRRGHRGTTSSHATKIRLSLTPNGTVHTTPMLPSHRDTDSHHTPTTGFLERPPHGTP